MNIESIKEWAAKGTLFLTWDWTHKAELSWNGKEFRLALPRTGVNLAVTLEPITVANHPGTPLKVTTDSESWTANLHFKAMAEWPERAKAWAGTWGKQS